MEAWLVAQPFRPSNDVKWLAGARDENRLDMIDRRRPQPWTHAEPHKIINEGLLTIVGKCRLLAGHRGENVPAPVILSSHRSTFKTQGRIRRVMGREKTDSYQTIAPKHILRRDYIRVMRPKPVPGVARSIEMAPSNVQCLTVGGVK